MHLAHPLGIPAGQVIVHRHHMHPAPREGVQVGRQGGHQGFSFPGLHFCNLPVVQHNAAQELHIKVAHSQHPLARFANHGKGFGQDVV